MRDRIFSQSCSRSSVVLGILLILTILTGCANGPATLHTQLSSYNDWPSLPADKTYSFSRTLKFQNSLELTSYEALVREELNKLGFKESSTPAQARLLVTLRPALSRESWNAPYMGDPFWPRFGVGFYGGYRPIYGHPYFYPYPYYSAYYYPFGQTTPTYVRSLRLEIDAQGVVPLKRIYEGTVQTEGWDDSLPKVMPYLVRALFSDFPGNNGEIRNVDVVIEK